MLRWFKGDRWNRIYGFVIPFGAPVLVVRFFTHRRALVNYGGLLFTTMLYCLSKTEVNTKGGK